MDAKPFDQSLRTRIPFVLEVAGGRCDHGGHGFAVLEATRRLIQHENGQKTFDLFRTHLAKSILIGVELLIAADIVGTVIVWAQSWEGLAALGRRRAHPQRS